MTVCAVATARSEVQATRDLMGRWGSCALLSGLLATAFCLVFERWQSAKKSSSRLIFVILNVVALAMGFVFLVTVLLDLRIASQVRLVALLMFLTLAVLCMQHAINNHKFEISALQNSINIVTAEFFALVVYVGVAAILLSIDRLLGVEIEDGYYWSFLIWIFCSFVPTFVLAKWPLYAASPSGGSHVYPK